MTFEERALRLAEVLQSRSLRLGAAESCTGGWVSEILTSIPGSSNWFEGAIVSYSNRMKERQLGVPKELLVKHGAVSQQVVESMARGVIEKLEVPLGVSVSGIAGPDGGTEDKPVGTVWIGWCFDNRVSSALYHFQGSRDQVRRQAVEQAIEGLESFLELIK